MIANDYDPLCSLFSTSGFPFFSIEISNSVLTFYIFKNVENIVRDGDGEASAARERRRSKGIFCRVSYSVKGYTTLDMWSRKVTSIVGFSSVK